MKKNKIVLLLNELLYIIVIPACLFLSLNYYNSLESDSNNFGKIYFSSRDIIILFIVFFIISLMYLFSKFSLKKKIFKVLDKINFVLSIIGSLLIIILDYCFLGSGPYSFTRIMIVLIAIMLFLSILNIRRIAKVDIINLERKDYLPIILNLIFTLIIMITFLVNRANLSIHYDQILILYYYEMFLIIPHLLFNIYLCIVMREKFKEVK